MSLIKCPECGKDVSDKAKTCPNCGNPLVEKQTNKYLNKIQTNKRKMCIICSLLIFVFMVVVLISKNKPINSLSEVDMKVFNYANEIKRNTINNDSFALDVVWCYCKDSTIHYIIQYKTSGTSGTPNISLIEYTIDKNGKESVDDFKRTDSLSAQFRDIVITNIKIDYLTLVDEKKMVSFDELNSYKDGYILIDVDAINNLLQK